MNQSLLLYLGVLWLGMSHAFLLAPSSLPRVKTLQLWGKVKRGKLGSIVKDGEDSWTTTPPPKRTKKKLTSKKSTKTKSNFNAGKAPTSSTISPALQAFMNEPDGDSVVAEPTQTSSSPATTFSSFETSKRSKGKKLSNRKLLEEERKEQSFQYVQQLEDILEEEKPDIQDIIAAGKRLITLQSENLRRLTAGATPYDFRLAWVGSDEALCQIGTGLHKLPLARLQEVFLTCQGRSSLEILEVIRVIGPFPNVRNTIKGDCKVKLGEVATDWKMTFTSMIDGTGKEILAGTEENVRNTNLQVYFCDENAIVAVVPPEDGSLRADPFEDNGSNVLIFVREEDLEDKLEALRVA